MKPKAGSESNEIDNPFGQTDQDKERRPEELRDERGDIVADFTEVRRIRENIMNNCMSTNLATL